MLLFICQTNREEYTAFYPDLAGVVSSQERALLPSKRDGYADQMIAMSCMLHKLCPSSPLGLDLPINTSGFYQALPASL